jgi:hypothetical protein
VLAVVLIITLAGNLVTQMIILVKLHEFEEKATALQQKAAGFVREMAAEDALSLAGRVVSMIWKRKEKGYVLENFWKKQRPPQEETDKKDL